MSNALTKNFATITVQKPSYKVWRNPVTVTTTTQPTLTPAEYAYYKAALFAGNDFLYAVSNPTTIATYFDVYDNEIPAGSYSIVFYSASTISPFNVYQPRLRLYPSQVVAGTTSTVTTPGYFETVTPAAYQEQTATYAWDASAASVNSFTGDGHASFTIGIGSNGAVVGLVELGSETGSQFETIEYAIHVTDGAVRVLELGIPKTLFATYDSLSALTIQKKDTVVEYLIGSTLFYTSDVASLAGDTLTLDAALFKSGDAVIDASIAGGISPIGWKSTPINYGVSSLVIAGEGSNPGFGETSLTLSEVAVQESTHNGVDSLRLSDTKELFVNNDIFMESNLKLSSSSAVVEQTKDALAVTQAYSCDVVRFGVSNLYLSQSVIPVQYGVSDLHLSGVAYRVAAGSSDLLLTQVATVEQIRSPKTSLTLAQAYTAVAARGLKSDLVLSSSYTQSRARATAAQHLLKLRQNFTVGVVKAFVPVTPSSGLISLVHQARVGNLAKSRETAYSFEYNILGG